MPIEKNEMETIRNKGLYLTQRLEKLDNPEIKFGFICQPYEDTKTVKVKVVFDNEPKLLTKSKLMNEFLCFFHERANYAVNHLSIENKALDLATRVMSHFESTCKDLYSPEQREKTNYLLKSKNLPILEPFEQLIERKRLFFKSFKEKYNQEGIELLINLVKLVNDPSLSLEKRNDFINWFEGI